MNSLEKRVLRIIGDDPDSPDVFDDDNITPIRDSINDAIEEIAVMSGADKITYRMPIYANQNFYRFSFPKYQLAWVDSVYLPEKNRHVNQTSLGSVERRHPRWLTTSNTPEEYFIVGVNYIGFYPIYGDDGYHANIKCTILPTRYTRDTDVLRLREDRENAVIAYAAAEYFLTVLDMQSAIHWISRYNQFASTLNFKSTIPEKWRRLHEV